MWSPNDILTILKYLINPWHSFNITPYEHDVRPVPTDLRFLKLRLCPPGSLVFDVVPVTGSRLLHSSLKNCLLPMWRIASTDQTSVDSSVRCLSVSGFCPDFPKKTVRFLSSVPILSGFWRMKLPGCFLSGVRILRKKLSGVRPDRNRTVVSGF